MGSPKLPLYVGVVLRRTDATGSYIAGFVGRPDVRAAECSPTAVLLNGRLDLERKWNVSVVGVSG
jgi:hypothetical protein